VSSLTGLESLVVRSSLKTARYANTVPDLEADGCGPGRGRRADRIDPAPQE
jgi:hypothetical protein